YPYADTRAARMLSEALRKYTSEHPGGVRALAAKLGMKQGANLSHMANGRMPIPLDRATEISAILPLNLMGFCLAVLEQRAPAVYQALEDQLPLRRLASASSQVSRACDVIANAPQ